ncbi:MAG: LysR family transcriptional regulator [Peptococcaceae bacterium]|nr:LysR family transcriptional regulator [Peptococcaceae bacterium]
MELSHLKYFMEAADMQHITKAAHNLFITQPSLSKTIKNLEDEIGVKLFDRVGKRIQLNAKGRVVYKYTKKIFENLDSMKTEIEDLREASANTLTIAMSAATKLTPVMLMGFHTKYPAIKIEILYDLPEDEMRKNSDLYITASRERPSDESSSVLLEEECFIALPVNHAQAKKNEIQLRDLENENFLVLYRHKSLGEMTRDLCISAGFKPNIVLECSHHDTILTFIAIGMGIAIIPSISWNDYSMYPIKTVRLKDAPCHRYVNIYWHNDRYISQAARLFMDFAHQFFRDLTS